MKIDFSVTMYENGDKPTALENEKPELGGSGYSERIATQKRLNSTIAEAPYFYNGSFAMSGGYFSLPRSFTRDPLWYNLSIRYRMIFLVILEHVAYTHMVLDDHGKKTIIRPGQLLTTERQLVEWCHSKDITKTDVHRSIPCLNRVGFLNHEVNHKKTLLTITRRDILDLIEPRNEPVFEPRMNQERTKNEPQKNKENTDKKDNNNINPLNPPSGDDSLCSPKENKISKKKKIEVSELALTLTDYFQVQIKSANPKILDLTPEKRLSWGKEMDLMLNKDKRSEEEIKIVIDFLITDPYSRPYIQCVKKLRSKFTSLWDKKNSPKPNQFSRGNYMPTSDAERTRLALEELKKGAL